MLSSELKMNFPNLIKGLVLALALVSLVGLGGCKSSLPQYMAPPTGPVSKNYPMGHDPYIPMDHNPSPLNPFDLAASVMTPFMYGPPR